MSESTRIHPSDVVIVLGYSHKEAALLSKFLYEFLERAKPSDFPEFETADSITVARMLKDFEKRLADK
jgi:hypothetical protein